MWPFGFEYLYLIKSASGFSEEIIECKHRGCLLKLVGLSAVTEASDTFNLHICVVYIYPHEQNSASVLLNPL